MPAHKISLTVRVLTVLQRSPYESLKPCQVARALNIRSNTVRVLLGRLCDRGDAVHVNGLYRAASTPEPEVTIWQLFGVR